jgi:ABC-type antimicrobial peptide transport system ATPase subunit
MSNDIKIDKRIATGIPSEEYKDNWDRIFKPSLWRKRKSPVLCGACGIDLSKGAKCRPCTEVLEGKS